MIDHQEPHDDTDDAENQAPKSGSPNTGHEGAQRQKADQEAQNDRSSTNQNPGPPRVHFFRGTLAGWITVFFTGTIAVIGYLQLCVYRQQKEIMNSAGKLQVGVARLTYGIPSVVLTPWMGVYDNNGQVFAVVNMYNQGRVFANSIQAAIKVDFLESEPTDYNFGDQAFQSANPSTLPIFDSQTIPYDPNVVHPTKKVAEYATMTVTMPTLVPRAQGLNYARKKIYVWGIIRFKDFTGDWAEPYKFCRFTPTESFFETGNRIAALDCGRKTTNQQ